MIIMEMIGMEEINMIRVKTMRPFKNTELEKKTILMNNSSNFNLFGPFAPYMTSNLLLIRLK